MKSSKPTIRDVHKVLKIKHDFWTDWFNHELENLFNQASWIEKLGFLTEEKGEG